MYVVTYDTSSWCSSSSYVAYPSSETQGCKRGGGRESRERQTGLIFIAPSLSLSFPSPSPFEARVSEDVAYRVTVIACWYLFFVRCNPGVLPRFTFFSFPHPRRTRTSSCKRHHLLLRMRDGESSSKKDGGEQRIFCVFARDVFNVFCLLSPWTWQKGLTI